MIEILLVLVAFMLAAKKPVRRRGNMARYLRGKVNQSMELATLAGTTLIAVSFSETLLESARLTSIVATYSISDFTPAVDDGPITVGIAHGDYTAAEIEEVLENSGSWAAGNLVAKEIANRKIRRIGTFDLSAVQASTVGGAAVLNDGKAIKTKLNWLLRTGQTLKLWAYNEGSGALVTGSSVSIQGHVNIFLN